MIGLSRAEQWVVHHVLLDCLGLADGRIARTGEEIDDTDETRTTLSALDKLEAGRFEFTSDELDVLRRGCRDHAAHTEAAADRNLATAVAERIDFSLDAARQ